MQPDRKTGAHGLPAEYRTEGEEREGWGATSGYLGALERSGHPVVVAIADPRLAELHRGRLIANLAWQVGYLRRIAIASGEIPHLHRFGLHWPDRDRLCSDFLIDDRLFQGARLITLDGDDFFTLELDLGPVSLRVLDYATNAP